MSALLAFLIAHADVLLLLLLALSEYLAMNKRVRANGVVQLLIEIIKKLKGKDKLVG